MQRCRGVPCCAVQYRGAVRAVVKWSNACSGVELCNVCAVV
jgi:hypothetical protein